MSRVACIGECMIELREEPDGRLSRGFGGDTLNTAVYLARLGVETDYVTALGDDPWSDELLAAWRAEGVGTEAVLRIPGRLPGLYIIQTDSDGERRFSYWRDSAAARLLLERQEAGPLLDELGSRDLIYLSGITLSLYGEAGRERLRGRLRALREAGRGVAFDSNFRPRGWPDRDEARRAFRAAFSEADIVLASAEDLELLFGPGGEAELRAATAGAEVVLKRPDLTCLVTSGAQWVEVAAEPVPDVVDTTAAGDSFAAAYLAARLAGADPAEAAAAGHRLAGEVVRHRGAIIPREAMPKVS